MLRCRRYPRRSALNNSSLYAKRLENWRQTPERRIHGPEEAAALIGAVGVATVYPASPEVPNLYHAYTGDPDAATDSGHDSPSGEVYGWRWTLGRAEAGFYTAIVRKRPTWVRWDLLPAVIRLRGELRSPAALYQSGELSAGAQRIAEALEGAGGVLSTGELRREAGFPTGKTERAAYLRAVEELDTRLLLAKVFSPDDLDMRHALVRTRYPQAVAAAEALGREAALERFLETYLPPAVYAAPELLARHLGLPIEELRAGLDQLLEQGRAQRVSISGYKGECYEWCA